MDKIDFEFLAWLVRCCLFRDDLRAQIEGLGFPGFAFALYLSDARKNGDLVGMYQDYGMYEPEAWNAWIADCRRQYDAIKTRNQSIKN